VTSAYDIAKRLYEQGKKDGLDNDSIRKDIEAALAGVVKSRQLRNILPSELKQKYTLLDLAIIAESESEEEEDMDGKIGTEPPASILQPHGEPEEEKLAIDYFADINRAAYDMWKSLTREDNLPHAHEDLENDHIKPTRKFRTGLVHKLGTIERNGLYRDLGCLIAVINDIRDTIREAYKINLPEEKNGMSFE
jgi:hypothetical protein